MLTDKTLNSFQQKNDQHASYRPIVMSTCLDISHQ
jgi:hypothetical protein